MFVRVGEPLSSALFKSVLVTNIQKHLEADLIISSAWHDQHSQLRPEWRRIEGGQRLAKKKYQVVFAIQEFNDKTSICKENILTGLDEEKKSINFPMVKGILIDTAEEINRSPMAMNNDFLSGLARAKILRKEETFCGVLLRICAGRNRASIVVFLGVTFCWNEDWVELNLQLVCQILEDDRDGMIPKSVFCRKGWYSRQRARSVCCLRGLENLGEMTPGSGGPDLGRNPRAQMPNMILKVASNSLPRSEDFLQIQLGGTVEGVDGNNVGWLTATLHGPPSLSGCHFSSITLPYIDARQTATIY